MRFSGMSFGGIYGGGTTIFSKRYKLNIYKNSKTKEWERVVKKKWFPISNHFFFLLFPIIDVLYYVIEFKSYLIYNFINWVVNPFKNVSTSVDVSAPSFYILIWVFQIIIYFLIGFFFVFLYFVCFKGVRKWHGCEHKVIVASENNDLDNAIKYNPISDRCGGTYMITIYLTMGLYWYSCFYIFHLMVPIGIMTFILLVIELESRLFHKYNRLGIWFGKLIQRYCTIKEPEEWQLKLGINGMKELIDVEYNNKKIEVI